MNHTSKDVDPVTIELLRSALPAITNEISFDLQRTSYNMMIYDVRDYCCALVNERGELLSQNMGGVSHFVADLGTVIKDGVERFGSDGFAPGDVVITNHQAVAGQHLNNMVVYTPTFWQGKLFAFAVVRAHWVDVGGLSTGFGAGGAAIDPWMEGLQIDQLKLYENGVPDAKLLKMVRDNIRMPDAAMGDLRSQVAACHLAEKRVGELLSRYGWGTVQAGMRRIFDDSEARCRKIVETIADGEYRASSYIDHDWLDYDQPVPFDVKVIVCGSDMTIDLTECSEQRRGPINSRTMAAPYIAYKAITTPLEPVNEGSFRALRVDIQEGNLMKARYPAPMAAWSAPLPTVVDTILAALAPAMRDKVPAAHTGALGGSLSFWGSNPETGRHFVMISIEGGGWGGRPWEDGESASVSVCQGDVRNASIEKVESKCPVIIESRALREDSAGAGKYRGGVGVATRVRNLVEGYWNLSGGGREKLPPWGLWGGKSGARADQRLKISGDDEFRHVDRGSRLAPAGSVFVCMTAGGGGWGDPLDRDPESVSLDVGEGLVSLGMAAKEYGVVFDPFTLEVDHEMTKRRRMELREGSLSRMPEGGEGTLKEGTTLSEPNVASD